MNDASQRAQSIITIKVEDKNDCEPQFWNQPYIAVISRDIAIGEEVINVKATDEDEGLNGAVRLVFTKITFSKTYL